MLFSAGPPTTLYSFADSTDGGTPSGITIDTSGDLFGVAQHGGASGHGCIWELPKGSMTITTLYSFTGGADGSAPAAITMDSSGDLFGTTGASGPASAGTVWELAHGAGSITTLYSFTGGLDGGRPLGITIDSSGNLFGTAQLDGADTDGTVWELASGSRTVTTLYSFTNGVDGKSPWGITIDTSGNLYGTTVNGGVGNGIIWELAKGSNTVTTLYTFNGGVAGAISLEGITVDDGRNLYGTAIAGGANGDGTIWEMPYQSGTTFPLYSFTTNVVPAGIIIGNKGMIHGVTEGGGTDGDGTIFKMGPFYGVATSWCSSSNPPMFSRASKSLRRLSWRSKMPADTWWSRILRRSPSRSPVDRGPGRDQSPRSMAWRLTARSRWILPASTRFRPATVL